MYTRKDRVKYETGHEVLSIAIIGATMDKKMSMIRLTFDRMLMYNNKVA
jgi:hypothetical protein